MRGQVKRDMKNGGRSRPLALKSVWRFLKKLKIELPDDPAVPLLGVYLKKYQSAYKRHLHSLVYTMHSNQNMESA